jgi:hypothetical protein
MKLSHLVWHRRYRRLVFLGEIEQDVLICLAADGPSAPMVSHAMFGFRLKTKASE